jgi:hypothetical protein
MVYQRFPGPWKRCADAVYGDAIAGALFEHILLRFRTNDGLLEGDSGLWIAQSVRCWQDEVPLSQRRFNHALQLLKRANLIEVKVVSLSNWSPSPITHLQLTPKGKEYLKPKRPGSIGSKPHRRVRRRDHVDSPETTISIQPAVNHKILPTKLLCKNNSELSVAPDGARESLSDEGRKEDLRKEETESHRNNESVPRAKDVEAVWLSAHSRYRPDLPCSPFDGSKWHFARTIVEKLGVNLTSVVEAVLRDWSGFRSYLRSERGAKTVSNEPDLACLAVHADAARHWLNLQEEEKRRRAAQEAQWRSDEAIRLERRNHKEREEYERLMANADHIRAHLEDLPRELAEALKDEELSVYCRAQTKQQYEEAMQKERSALQRLEELKLKFGASSGNDKPVGGVAPTSDTAPDVF